MCTFVPFLEHRWEATLTPALSPWAVSTVMTPTPARTPEEKAEGSQHEEEEEERDQEAKEAEPKSPGAIEGHSVSIAIIGIGRSCRLT